MNNYRASFTLILTAAFVTAPLLVRDFSGFSADQLPIPQVNPPVQPAGYAFGIWGIIYLWLLVSAIYGLVWRRNDMHWNAVRPSLCLSLAFGVPWLWVAQQSALWATVLILPMTGAAIAALIRTPDMDAWLLRGPVALYAGWLTAASGVALATIAAGYGIGLGSYGWAFVGIIAALSIAIAVYRARPAPVYLIAIIWALVGIGVANGFDRFLVTATALGGVAILICVMAIYAPPQHRN